MQKKKIQNREETYKIREEFGAKLKEARLQAGLSERDLIHLTRISPPFIHALESGDFEKLPGKVFAKGFVKSICHIIQQNPEAFLEHFERCWEEAPVEANHTALFKSNPKKKLFHFFQQKEKKVSKYKWLYMGATSFVALFIGLWFFSHPKNAETTPETAQQLESEKVENNENGEKKTIETADIKKEEAPIPAPEAKKEDLTTVPEVKKEEGTPPAPAIVATTPTAPVAPTIVEITPTAPAPQIATENEKKLPVPAKEAKEEPKKEENSRTLTQDISKTSQEAGSLVLRVIQDVEIRTKIDTEKSEIKKYVAGEYSFKFKENIDLYVMDISLIEIDFNGQKLVHLGPAGTERKLSFSTQEEVKKVL